MAGGTHVVIPVKAFGEAKSRLSPALGAGERAELAQHMASHVVASAAPLPVAVVCDDEGVAAWARSAGAEVIWCPGTGLNGAVQQGVSTLAARGVDQVVVAHSDLPFSPGFARLRPWPGVTLVPDRHHSGTNVIAVPTCLDFQFSFGTGSFRRHVREAVRLRAGLRIIHEPALGWDIDYPADLLGFDHQPAGLVASGDEL